MIPKEKRQSDLLCFVHLHHYPQKRKYTGELYTSHLIAVAEMALKHNILFGYEIGLCHDLFEDTQCTNLELYKALISYGYSCIDANYILDGAIALTDVYTSEEYPNLNRKKRKKLECERLAKINSKFQSIKYCDFIDNTKSIIAHDANFAKTYLAEKKELLSVMNKGNKTLFNLALKSIENVKPTDI